MKRNTKKTLLIGSASLLAVVLGVTVINHTAANGGLFAYRAKAANYDNLSVTFNSSSTVLEGSLKSTFCVLGSSLQVSGFRVKATITNSTAPGTDGVISRFAADTASVYFYVSDSAAPSVTNFQSISSISFGYKEGTQSGNFKVMWSNDNSYWNTISVASGTSLQSLPLGAHYVGVVNDGGYAQFTSFTINYSCSTSPVSHEHSISYYGLDGQDLDGIVPESLEYSAEAGKHVVIEPYYYPLYEFYYANEYNGSYITDFEVKNGIIEFTMPDHDISIEIAVVQADVELDYIVLSGQTTSYSVGDLFEFDGTVTAYYTDLSFEEVEPTDVSEPDMSTAGEKTVTVTYSDGMNTKTADYTITVTSGSTQVVLDGTYTYTSRTEEHKTSYSTPTDWTGKMSLIFTSDGKCTWRNVRTDSSSNEFDCKVFFDYVAINNGANITLSLTVCDGNKSDKIDFKKNGVSGDSASWWAGGYIDRPTNGGILVDKVNNNSGVLNLDKTTLTIDVYEYVSLSKTYERYDTFTFSLASN